MEIKEDIFKAIIKLNSPNNKIMGFDKCKKAGSLNINL